MIDWDAVFEGINTESIEEDIKYIKREGTRKYKKYCLFDVGYAEFKEEWESVCKDLKAIYGERLKRIKIVSNLGGKR